MVRPFKVVLLGKTEKGYIWQYTFLVFAREPAQATRLAAKAAKEEPRDLKDIRIFKVREYKTPRVEAELKGGWPDEEVIEDVEENGGYENLPTIDEFLKEAPTSAIEV
uniref:Uncharacterized protein n=1 Tax=Thermococcus sp. IRI48 TaxID=1197734 RepID=L0B9J6_9EURY|nr:hypothetical protein [Thermococcus sp. IRI48]AFZ84233.1 hypothetical protein i48-7 [Thermococcus sp. IRI48]